MSADEEVVYVVEHSPSGRAACRGCKEKIEKGGLRFLKQASQDEADELGYAPKNYFHLGCLKLPNKVKQNSDADSFFEKVHGKDALNTQDMKRLKKAIVKAFEPSSPKKRKKSGDDQTKDSSSAANKKPRKTKSKKPKIEIEQAEDKPTTEEEKLIEKYRKLTTSELKDYLRSNDQLITGQKEELVKRCADGELNGALPKCPVCGKGKLHKHEDGSYRCGGYFDEDIKMAIRCSFVSDTVERVPWKIPGDEDEGDDVKESRSKGKGLKKEKLALATEAELKELQNQFDKMGASNKKKIVEALVNFARSKNVKVPKDDAAAKSRIAPCLMGSRNEDGQGFDAKKAFDAVVKEMGTGESKEKEEEDSKPRAKVEENDGLADALEHLAALEAKVKAENYVFKVRALKTAVVAIRNLDFAVESGKQISDPKSKHKVKNVGKGIGQHVDEFLKSGEIPRSKELEKEIEARGL